MEPLAPGTEDDPPINYSSLNKQENEQERLLKLKAILPTGKYGNVFELTYVNGAEHWFCNACKCPVMGRVYQHENGRRHSINLSMMNRHNNKNSPISEDDEPVLQLAPGEPVPPGFEGEVEKTAQIQERLDGFRVGPLVALEYLVEMQDYDPSKEPFYLCVLCDKRGDPRTVLTHLASYNHISQYLQKHFPTCYRALAPYITKQYKRNWQSTLQKLAEAIEKKYGRMKPMPVEKDKFDKDRMNYLQMICKGRHFSEQMGCTFEELIVHDELTKVYEDEKGSMPPALVASTSWSGGHTLSKPFQKRSPSPPVVARPTKKAKASFQGKQQAPKVKGGGISANAGKQGAGRRRSLSSVSSISSSDLSDFEGNKGKSRARKRSPPRNNPVRRRSPSPSRRDEHPQKRDRLMPWQRENYRQKNAAAAAAENRANQKERTEKMEEYKKLAKAIENDMEKSLKFHEKNPEKHPQYNEEWKKFWNKRYKELQVEGVDVAKYDFKPEWIMFWNKRMVEIQNEEIKNKKDALRRRLGLPEEPAPICFRITGKGKFDSPTGKTEPPPEKKPPPMAAQPDQDPEIIIIEDKDDETKSSKRSHSPWERESPPRSKISNLKGRDKRSYSKDRSGSMERSRYRNSKERNRSRDRRVSRDRSRERKNSRDRNSRERRSSRDRVLRRTRSRSRERYVEKKREYRESSYERDLRGRERVRVVSDLPWEREKAAYRQEYEDYYKPPSIMRDVTRQPVLHPSGPVILVEEEDDEEVNVVSVLRLLTALEERLGSLGPKVIDLLAQALAMEKNEANSADNLLDNDINCVVFETVKEKLKGQLLAGFVDMIQERAFKNAIKKTASLIYLAGQRKKEKQRLQPKVDPVKVPGIGTVDKAAIAKQIANALILQGKTDVTQAELEQLINAVVGMAEASKNSNKPMTTAGFLERLAGGSTSYHQESTEDLPIVKPKEETVLQQPILKENPKSPKLKLELSATKKESPVKVLTPSPGKISSNNMDHLSDSDLQTLLQNFKDLSTDEQHGLINYLKKLEAHEPDRVERLRKFVNLGANSEKPKEKLEEKKEICNTSVGGKKEETPSGRVSPFSHRLGGVNPAAEDPEKHMKVKEKSLETSPEQNKFVAKIHLDSDEEDYTFEDVVKAVSKNVKAQELEKDRKIVEESMKFDSKKAADVDLSDAKALISNLMSNISKSNSTGSNVNLLGLGGSSTAATSAAEFTKTLNSLPITMDSLANIVGNAHKLTQESKIRESNNLNKVNFDPSLLQGGSNNLTGFVGPDLHPNPQRPQLMSGGFRSGPMVAPRSLGPPSGYNAGANNIRPLVQYPVKNSPFGNYGQGFGSQPQQNMPFEYAGSRGNGPNMFEQRGRFGNNPRFPPGNYSGNQFNNNNNRQGQGPGGNNNNFGNNNRW